MTSQADFILHAGWLFSAEPDAEVIENAALAVKDGRIAAVGTRPGVEANWQSDTMIDLPEHLLLPGLVNAHTHSPMALMRGLGNDLPLHEWLYELIFPLEAKWVSSEFVADGARLAIAEMLRAGITCFADQYYFPEIIAQTARDIGIRAQIAVPIIEQPNNWSKSSEEGLRRTTELHDQWRGDDFITIAHGPHAPYTVDVSTFEKIVAISEEVQSQVHLHLHETQQEVNDFRLKHGSSPIRRLDEIGLLTPRLQAVHMTALDELDLEIIATNNVGVVHCPQSNALLASGPSPLARLKDAGVRVALGTDGAVSNNSLDLLQEIRAANLLSNAATGKTSALSAADFVRMGTLEAASLLGREQEIGSLAPGKRADMIAVDTMRLGAQPVYDVLANLLLTNSAPSITHVWVAGQTLLEDGAFANCDEREIIQRAKHWRDKIVAGDKA